LLLFLLLVRAAEGLVRALLFRLPLRAPLPRFRRRGSQISLRSRRWLSLLRLSLPLLVSFLPLSCRMSLRPLPLCSGLRQRPLPLRCCLRPHLRRVLSANLNVLLLALASAANHDRPAAANGAAVADGGASRQFDALTRHQSAEIDEAVGTLFE
jgi:hypothetical protein